MCIKPMKTNGFAWFSCALRFRFALAGFARILSSRCASMFLICSLVGRPWFLEYGSDVCLGALARSLVRPPARSFARSLGRPFARSLALLHRSLSLSLARPFGHGSLARVFLVLAYSLMPLLACPLTRLLAWLLSYV